MGREDVTRMALESGFQGMAVVMHAEHLERFFTLVFEAGAAAEREACAKVCDDANAEIADAEVLAERIRERGDE
jgi:hypothetical protein